MRDKLFFKAILIGFGIPIFYILFMEIFIVPSWGGEAEKLAMQYGEMKALRTHYESKVEKLVIDMSIIEQRFLQIKKMQAEEKKADETPVENPANAGR